MFRSIALSFALLVGFVPIASPPAIAYSAHYFSTSQSAQRHCPHDIVVWLNTRSGIYHYAGERWYGNTKQGAYVCEKEAIAEGDRATRNGQ
jgi:hypothetical protein